MNFNKVIDIEDFTSPSLLPFLEAAAIAEMHRLGEKKPVLIPDSKHWESAMALHAFNSHNLLHKNKLFAGIGAGTEWLTEFLASQGSIVFPIDRYLEPTDWQDVAPSGFMIDRSPYMQGKTELRNIIPIHGDARLLHLPSCFFDAVYSSGSIEHFGGLDGVEAAAAEIGRVLKPGGFASISTEFRLEGPEHLPWFNDQCILFTPDLLRKHIIEASGLISLDTLKDRPSPDTFKTRKNLINFLESTKAITTFKDKAHIYPNLILYHEGFLFCSVHLFLQKPLDWKPNVVASEKSAQFAPSIQTNKLNAIHRLNLAFKTPSPSQLSQSQAIAISQCLSAKILRKLYSKIKKVPILHFYTLRCLSAFPRIFGYLRRRIKV